MYQTYTIIVLAFIVLWLVMYAAKAWQTARGLKQLIEMGPQVCEICATRASKQNHTDPIDPTAPHVPGNGGIFFADTHQYVPATMVFLPPAVTFVQKSSLEGTPGFSEDPLGG